MNTYWSSENIIKYYRSHRNNSHALYRSESVFISDVVKHDSNILDVGCAIGGFSRIVREFNPAIDYTGVDISSRMIEEARTCFPDDEFQVINGSFLPFQNNTFDTVISFGVLHMTETWKKLLAEAWRVCRKHLVFDVRLVKDAGVSDPALSFQKLEFGGEWDGFSTAPYIVVNVDEFMEVLGALSPVPGKFRSFGYIHPVSDMTVSPYTDVCMASFCLEKSSGRDISIVWDLPFKPIRKTYTFFTGKK